MKKIRCAIYTRKSAEEGLEQEFNSLDAQREACAAYVASQKAEGWVLLPTVYEDAGLSGGTLERPGLQRLLADIDAGLVEQIVVYKVDRLTRSLSDFAKLVERLEVAVSRDELATADHIRRDERFQSKGTRDQTVEKIELSVDAEKLAEQIVELAQNSRWDDDWPCLALNDGANCRVVGVARIVQSVQSTRIRDETHDLFFRAASRKNSSARPETSDRPLRYFPMPTIGGRSGLSCVSST